MSNQKDKASIVGAGWYRTSEKNPDFQYVSLRFSGNREEDAYEVILRRKSDSAEMLLNEVSVILSPNGFKSDSKEDEKKPDLLMKAFIEG